MNNKKRGCCGSTALAIVVARQSWREISLRKTQQMKNSLNFASTCLKVVDTRRLRLMAHQEFCVVSRRVTTSFVRCSELLGIEDVSVVSIHQ